MIRDGHGLGVLWFCSVYGLVEGALIDLAERGVERQRLCSRSLIFAFSC
jgi:hypothetical protein